MGGQELPQVVGDLGANSQMQVGMAQMFFETLYLQRNVNPGCDGYPRSERQEPSNPRHLQSRHVGANDRVRLPSAYGSSRADCVLHQAGYSGVGKNADLRMSHPVQPIGVVGAAEEKKAGLVSDPVEALHQVPNGRLNAASA